MTVSDNQPTIEQRIARVLSGPSIDERVAEVSRDLAQLHARLAWIVGSKTGFWGPNLPLEVTRAVFDSFAGEVQTMPSADRKQTYQFRRPYPGITLYCYDIPAGAPDHDLLAENNPDEWAEDCGDFYRFRRPSICEIVIGRYARRVQKAVR